MKVTKVITIELSEKELHIIADALRVAAINAGEDGNYTATEYDILSDQLDA